MRLLVFLMLVFAMVAAFADTVAVREGTMTVKWREGDYVWKTNPNRNNANYVDTKTMRDMGDKVMKTVELENRYVKVVVLPESGGQLAQLIYKPTNTEFFLNTPTASNELVGYSTGVKASFPYKELGIRFGDQPASYVVVKGDDGSVTVAEWMEFSRFNEKWNEKMYGRYGNMMLSQHITLRPDSAVVDVTYRIVNASAYRQGRQLWAVASLPRQQTAAGGVSQPGGKPLAPKTDTEWIYPAYHASSHSGTDFRVYGANELALTNLTNDYKSVFAWGMKYGFAGLWYPEVKVNRLRLNDTVKMPGAKQFYYSEKSTGALVELWGGSDSIFEEVDSWIEPGEAVELPSRYTLIEGIGKVNFANDDAALHVEFGGAAPVVEVVTLSPVTKLEAKLDGKSLGIMDCAPDKPARFELPKNAEWGKVTLVADGKTIVEQSFPLDLTPDEKAEAKIRESLDMSPASNERMGNQQALGRYYRNALGSYPAGTTGSGRVQYRDGQIANAITTLKTATTADATDGEAWHLLGCALLESGKADEARDAFTRAVAAEHAYPQARYFLALDLLAAGKDGAIEELTKLGTECPTNWEGRLLLAYLEATGPTDKPHPITHAKALVAEDPADPRAQYVLWQVAEYNGNAAAATAKSNYEELCKEPGTPRRMDEFKAALTGKYLPPVRLK